MLPYRNFRFRLEIDGLDAGSFSEVSGFDATMDVVERPTPGIPEAMRAESARITNRAMLSRAAAGIRKQTLIVNLPGSPKAVRESLACILPALEHGLDILRGNAHNCAAPDPARQVCENQRGEKS